MTPQENLVPCKVCDTLIPDAVHEHDVGLFKIQHVRDTCLRCEYQEFYRKRRLTACPYRKPVPPPRLDGGIPDSILKKMLDACGQTKE